MRHQQAEQPSTLRSGRPAPGKGTAPGRTAASLLALQRTVGNAAVAGLLSGSRAHEQRPGGSGIGGRSLTSTDLFERAPDAARAVQRVSEQEPGRAVRPAGKGDVREREQELSRKYGIRIGPPEGVDVHFGHAVLDRIDTALAGLPQGDLGPNVQLIAIEPDTSGRYTSSYDDEERTIGIVHPIIPGGFRAPDWLYARLNRGSRWQRKLMDRAVLKELPGIGGKDDRSPGTGKGKRHVMAGVSDELAHGNLVEWTLRHEVGHSVDVLVEWEQSLAGREDFGGWQVHESRDLDVVARAILRKAEVLDVLPAGLKDPVVTLSTLIRPHEDIRGPTTRLRLSSFFDRFKEHLTADELTRRRDIALRFVQLALAQPWSFDDGGADVLDVDGRTYHVDQGDKWVSYSTKQRTDHALSNYQFSTPKEWFAEAYAAYYDPTPGVGDRLSPGARAWFDARRPPTQADPENSADG